MLSSLFLSVCLSHFHFFSAEPTPVPDLFIYVVIQVDMIDVAVVGTRTDDGTMEDLTVALVEEVVIVIVAVTTAAAAAVGV